MFKLHIDVNGRNLSIDMTFIESRILTAFGWMIVRTRSYEGKKFTRLWRRRSEGFRTLTERRPGIRRLVFFLPSHLLIFRPLLVEA